MGPREAKQVERRKRVKELAKHHNQTEICEILGASMPTIRTDLRALGLKSIGQKQREERFVKVCDPKEESKLWRLALFGVPA